MQFCTGSGSNVYHSQYSILATQTEVALDKVAKLADVIVKVTRSSGIINS